jgi:hypothetical protein
MIAKAASTTTRPRAPRSLDTLFATLTRVFGEMHSPPTDPVLSGSFFVDCYVPFNYAAAV